MFQSTLVFLKSDSVTTALRFPRPGPPEQRTPTSSVRSERSDAPRRTRPCLCIRFAAPIPPLPEFAPGRRRVPTRPGPVLSHGAIGFLEMGRTQGLPGSWGVHPIPMHRSTIPAGPAGLTLATLPGTVPANPTTRTPAMLVSELNHAASVSAAYASSRALPHAHARLASGWWLAFAGRASNPLDSDERFPSATSDLPLSQAYPGATDFQSRSKNALSCWLCKEYFERTMEYSLQLRTDK